MMWHWGYYILVRRWFKMPISTENKRMQQLTGRFADLNTSNMLVGEFAVPNDHNPVVKMDNGKIREIPLLSDMDSYENKIQEVNGAIVKLNNEYESTKNQLVAATKANADSAAKSAAAAASSAGSASTYKDNAKTYMDNANAYAKEAKTAASSITGALKPKGTVTFANLPTLSTVEAGAMYNISTAFTSNANFKDGGNITYPAGTNVYKTEDGMWDCLAGELGDYLMKDDIDTAVEESMPDYTASTQLTELVSGEKLSTALGKIKTAVKNVISLVKLLGTTDISKIGNGTVTGAISSLNSNLSELIKIKMYNTQTNNIYEYFDAIEGYMPIAVIYGHPSDNIHCTGFSKDNWADSATGNYVAWFSDKIGAGSKYIVIWIKNNN